ncbi:hypothetical protein [Cryptosporangium arvum]|uniref:hypothetical protein n=1 Tax=Cryptosporangium arvum TaxID=80871 RepID=UPI0012ED38B5|nr:hypothetical protein [Cryptosporangium arvum]
MGRRTRAVSLVLAIVAGVTACSGDEPTPRATPGESANSSATAAAFAAPPLKLPTVAAGQACPLSASKAWSGPGQATRVLGNGPLYPIADYFREGGATLDLRPDDEQPDGTYGKKVRWLSVGYSGPVLIRGGRLDGTGRAEGRFLYWGEPRDDGWFAVLPEEEYVDLPGATTVSGPGCFAFQVDGTNFSTTIVFSAVPAR